MQTKQVTTLLELSDIAREVLESCSQKNTAQVLALQGDLGVGKTAFTKELAKLLGIMNEVTSPTFVIMKSYPIANHPFIRTLTHIDAYRIESDDEMRVLGFDAILRDASQLVCIEWPENIESLIPKDALKINFTLNSDGTRDITYGS